MRSRHLDSLLVAIALALTSPAAGRAQSIETVAGGGPNHVPALDANLDRPASVAMDRDGNLFIAPANQNRVFEVDGAGQLTLAVGDGATGSDGDGGAFPAMILPRGIAVDAAGNLFFFDSGHHRIRRRDAATGALSDVAGNGTSGFSGDGGPATEASLDYVSGIALDAAGNLFFADLDNQRVRRVDAASGIIETVAGNGDWGFSGDDGPAVDASLARPMGLALDSEGNLFIADRDNNRVRRVDASSAKITTVAGNGTSGFGGDGDLATRAELDWPVAAALDGLGNLFIADQRNQRVRRVDSASATITTVAGDGADGFRGDGFQAVFAWLSYPSGVVLDAAGNVFIADTLNSRVRRVDVATRVITSIAGNGSSAFSGEDIPALNASLSVPGDVAVDPGDALFIADTSNQRIRRVDAATGIIRSVAGDGHEGFTGDGKPALSTRLANPLGVAVDAAGNLFVADEGNSRVRLVDAVTQVITTVAGNGSGGFDGDDGPATAASLDQPGDVALDANLNLFIADTGNNRIRRVDATSGVITTVAGNGSSAFGGDDGPARDAGLDQPSGIAIDPRGNLLIADSHHHRIRRVDAATGIITTIAGDGNAGSRGDCGPATSAQLFWPSRVAVDAAGNLFITDLGNDRIRRVEAATGIITTFAGNGVFGFGGDGGPATSASFRSPDGIALDAAGGLLIADSLNDRVRRVSGMPMSIAIDIKPGSAQNVIQPLSRGVIWVAILGSQDFDVSTVDGTTLAFGKAAPVHDLGDPAVFAAHLRDVDGDGFTDLVSHYRTAETGIEAGDLGACLSGETLEGASFLGADTVHTVPALANGALAGPTKAGSGPTP